MRKTLFCAALILAGCPHAQTPVSTTKATVDAGAAAPTQAMSPATIDAMVHTAWQAKGVSPADPANDATYLRRVTLDITGKLPTPERVVSFLADTSKDKREKLVDELLQSPAYAEHWSQYWDDELMGAARGGPVDRAAFRAWLRTELSRNAPWNEMVYALLTSTGQNSGGGTRVKTTNEAAMQAQQNDDIDGAVNYLLRFVEAPQDVAGNASRTFLGIQIQCAQCHDHKTEKWKQTDFQGFASAFFRVQLVPQGKDMGIRKVELRDVERPPPRYAKMADLSVIAKAPPTTLDGTKLEGNVRQGMAKWMTQSPAFATEMANRMWAHFLGRGFVNPIDDIRPSNPADAPEILDVLAKDFSSHGYDVKRLMKTIALTEAYGLSSKPPAGADTTREIALWSRFRVVPLGPMELLETFLQATGADEAMRKLGKGDVEQLKERLRILYSFVFDVDEDADASDYQGTITQALVMMNGKLTQAGTSPIPGTVVNQIVAMPGDEHAKIEALYLRILSRKPTDAEEKRVLAYISDAPIPGNAPDAGAPNGKAPLKQGGDPLARMKIEPTKLARLAALEDVVWAMLNSSEFVFNH